ncbi:DUF6879 family protein [Streptomyces sulphureus]|uniref:DUF6879 family protein n=1 Tax=Streptomyces sulphureus TaxID=47758 RepID=UPI000367D2A5|nr:DUF6879 family protein [Streptomyces sulphureus]
MPSNVPPITDLLDAAQATAVHLEMRDVYAVSKENPHVALWRETGERPNDPDSEYWKPWSEIMRRTTARGVQVRRARIVSLPASQYIRYEHAGTPVNLAVGEDVRWLARDTADGIALPANDFWLFDGQLVRYGYFDGDGELVGHSLSEEHEEAELCAHAFEKVWERASPHNEFAIS